MQCIELSNSQLRVSLSNYGARLMDLKLLNQGRAKSLVVSYPNIDDYKTDAFYMGATIGPVANRVRHGQFSLAQQTFKLPANEGHNSLHSGEIGFDSMFWNVSQQSTTSVTFELEPDLSKYGFPLDLSISLRYQLCVNRLRINYRATCSEPAYLNLSNHTYWNLGDKETSITDHEFELFACAYAEKNNENLPTGTLILVDQPLLYDFKNGGGYSELRNAVDHHFIVDEQDRNLKKMLRAFNPKTGNWMCVSSTKPGFQFYSGHFLTEPFTPYSGFCVEPQFAPDAINLPQFVSPRVDQDQPYSESIEFEFGVE